MVLNRLPVAAGALVLAGAALAGCSSDSAVEADADAACTVSVTDAWVRATDEEMTGAFGVLTNNSDVEMVVVSATSAFAGMMEIHEVIESDGKVVMQPLEGGIVLAGGASVVLAPGGTHLMLMDLPQPIEPGETVEITMTCADGGTAAYSGVAKPFEGGDEEYQPAMEEMDAMADASADAASMAPSASAAN